VPDEGAGRGLKMILDLEEEVLDEIRTYLDEEIKKAKAERDDGKTDNWTRWRLQREGFPEKKVANYPWNKAANTVVPVTAINCQTAFGKFKSAMGSKKPFWTLTAFNKSDPEQIKDAQFMTKYFNIISESQFDLDLRRKNNTILYESGSMGTSFVKVPFTRNAWNYKAINDEGLTEESEMVTHVGAELVPIPLEDLIYRQSSQDLQTAPWVSHVVHLHEHQLVQRGAQGIYENVDEILGEYRTYVEDHKNDYDEETGVSQLDVTEYDLHEIYLYWDSDGDGVYEDHVITYHQPTRTFLRFEYNELGIRIIEPVGFLHKPFYIEGRGICQMSDHMQQEVNTHHRMRLNNMHIVNQRMFAVRKGSGVKANEKIYPGKFFFVDSPKEDIVPLQSGDIYQSSVQAESMAIQYAHQASGLPEIMGGFTDSVAKSRDTFGGQQLKLGQGMGLFNSIIENTQGSYSRIGMMIYFQLVYHREEVIEYERMIGRLTDEEIGQLERILSIQIKDIPFKMVFDVKTSDTDQTFEVRRQNYLSLNQLYMMYFKNIMPIIQMLYSPQAAQMVSQDMKTYLMRSLVGYTKIMERTFMFFGEEDVETFLVDQDLNEKFLDIIEQMQKQMLGQLEMLGGENGRGQMESGFAGVPNAGAGRGRIPGGMVSGGVPPVGGNAQPAGGVRQPDQFGGMGGGF
jgi:hypothetical protein